MAITVGSPIGGLVQSSYDRYGAVSLSANSTTNLTAKNFNFAVATLSASAIQTSTATNFNYASSSHIAQASTTFSSSITRSANASLQSNATVFGNFERSDIAATLVANASVNTNTSNYAYAHIELTAVASVSPDALNQSLANCELISQAKINLAPTNFNLASIIFVANTSLDAAGEEIVFGNATLHNQALINSLGGMLLDLNKVLTGTATTNNQQVLIAGLIAEIAGRGRLKSAEPTVDRRKVKIKRPPPSYALPTIWR